MDKKTLMILIPLVVLIILWWPLLGWLGIIKPPAEPPAGQADTTQTVAKQPAESVVDTPIAEPQALTPLPESVQHSATILDSAEVGRIPDTIFVNTDKYRLALLTRGGGPISIFLKEFHYKGGDDVQLLSLATEVTPNALFAGGTVSSSALWYEPSLLPGNYDVTEESLELSFVHRTAAGGELIKRYHFYPDSYHYDLVIEVNNRQALGIERKYALDWNTSLGVTEPNPEDDFTLTEAVAMMAGSRETLDDYEDDRLDQEMAGWASWVGVRNKYFAGIIIPHDVEMEGVHADGFKQKVSTPDGRVEERNVTAGLDITVESSQNFVDSFTVFTGPMDYALMADYNVGLEDILGIGTMPVVGWLIKPFAIGIIWLLPLMYKVIGNYGVVIILFALIIKLITMPLSMKSFKSMNAMKELQPKMEQLKEKHKKDPQRLNQEMMKLYKEHGVNPMSGCLPMLPQMPLFFALFAVFRSTILLRQAPFFGFIDDLSRGASSFTDPYIILVIIMIATQFMSQKLTMASTQQNKMMMMMMPLFMGFIFYKFASGLVLYWTCFSLFSLIDYFAFKRRNQNPQVKSA